MLRARLLSATLALLLIASEAALAEAPPEPPPSASPSSTASASAAEAVHYRVVVDAPAPLRDTLHNSVDLIRWQDYDEMTGALFDALVRQANEQAKEAAATEGFFAAQIDVEVNRDSRPFTVRVRVTPGPQATVAATNIAIEGAATADAQGADAIAKVKNQWTLPVGAPFRQPAWIDAKKDAVTTLSGESFAAAKLVSSEALVDPNASTVDLSVAIDSGPVFHVGELEITGLARYPEAVVRNYRTEKPGDRYSIAELNQFVRRLTGPGYFASVQAAIDPDPALADHAPVRVAVIEGPPKRIEAGLGFSTDTAFRGNVSYRDVDFMHRAVQLYVDARVESKLQNASIRFVRPPDANGWSPSIFASAERTDINNLVTETATAGVRMASLDERNQWQYGAAFYNDREKPSGQPAVDSHALYADVERAWRRVDDLASPTRGWIAIVQVGGGIPGVSTKGFGRVLGHFGYWYPINRQWSFMARAEGGAVLATSRDDIPSALLFRTGGDTTVRGYAYQSLGLQRGEAIVPARFYDASSIEITRWITDAWGIAAFVDAGNAFESWSESSLAFGYGVGARVRTPIGPFRFDVAYGEQSRQVRLHFSVGISF